MKNQLPYTNPNQTKLPNGYEQVQWNDELPQKESHPNTAYYLNRGFVKSAKSYRTPFTIVAWTLLILLILAGFCGYYFVLEIPARQKKREHTRRYLSNLNALQASHQLTLQNALMKYGRKEGKYFEKGSPGYLEDFDEGLHSESYNFFYFSDDTDFDGVDEANVYVILAVPKTYKAGRYLIASTPSYENFNHFLTEKEFNNLPDLEKTVKWIGDSTVKQTDLSGWDFLKDLKWDKKELSLESIKTPSPSNRHSK